MDAIETDTERTAATPADSPAPEAARAFARELVVPGAGDDLVATVDRALAISSIVEHLEADASIVAAAVLYPLLETGAVSKRALAKRFDNEVIQLARELVRLGTFGFPTGWDPDAGLNERQAETLRKMLFAIIEDVRLVLVRLADQLHKLRSVKNAPEDVRRQVAYETREIYAPLANKLGVWQLKWELEDLAFRFLEPDTYMRIAGWLKERRTDREAYIRRVIDSLQSALAEQGVEADIEGRPKHIYSIWRKMRRKQVDFEHVFDVRAVRILVDSVQDCYTALGLVHGTWPYIPGEFDDYIATPKDNGYSSLHTAVVGPEKKNLEIQIRTHEMHDNAELGVAAHWKYKEGGKSDASFEAKINWLRQILEPSAEGESEGDFIDRFKSEIFEDRVYALTPGGDILDLPAGSTPLDFAYYVHTDLGHRCRGARVGGRIVPLTYTLKNGDQVEVITARNGTPSRDWLIPQLGYLGSTRARAKARAWFRRQDAEHILEQGQALYDKEIQRLGVKAPHVSILCRDFGLSSASELYIALGGGDITVTDIAEAVQKRLAPPEPEPEPTPKPARTRKRDTRGGSGIEIEGVGDLLTNLAQCCKPVPPDPIMGFITQGRGVSIHRQDCKNALRLKTEQRERVLQVNWSGEAPSTYPVDILIEAFDRQGLVKDISALLSAEKINILGINLTTNRRESTANLHMTVEITGLDELSRVLTRLGDLPNVTSVRRKI